MPLIYVIHTFFFNETHRCASHKKHEPKLSLWAVNLINHFNYIITQKISNNLSARPVKLLIRKTEYFFN